MVRKEGMIIGRILTKNQHILIPNKRVGVALNRCFSDQGRSSSFFADHIGKFILAGISMIGYAIWRWVKKRFDIISIEELVEDNSYVSPEEMNELRLANETLFTFSSLSSLTKESSLHLSPSSPHPQFTSFLTQTLQGPVDKAYLLDRIMLGSRWRNPFSTLSPSSNNLLSKEEEEFRRKIEINHEEEEDQQLTFYLLALLSVATCSFEEKIELIFLIFGSPSSFSHHQLLLLISSLKHSFQLPSTVQVTCQLHFNLILTSFIALHRCRLWRQGSTSLTSSIERLGGGRC